MATISRFDIRSVSFIPCTIDTVYLDEYIDVFDHCAVNFLVGWFLLMLLINSFIFDSPYSQKKNTSSIYLHHRYSLKSAFIRIFSSSSATNRILHGSENFVPIGVCLFWLQVFLLNLKIYSLSTVSARWVYHLRYHIFPFRYPISYKTQKGSPRVKHSGTI